MTGPGSPDPVAIVGGGVSGLAAAVGLAAVGIPVLLLEQKPSLGGRAYSFRDSTTGETVDNGQHVLIAGYDRTLKFLETIGTLPLLAIQPRPALLFHHPDKGFQWFRLPKAPAPLHLLWGVATCALLSVPDRYRVLHAGRAIERAEGSRLEALKGITIEQWLHSVGQTAECVRSLWEPLAVSIMNERITHASACLFVRSLQKAFLSGWRSAALAIPKVGLTELYVDGARNFVTERGGEMRCGADVVGVLVEGASAVGVEVRGGEKIGAGAVILAVPPNRAASLAGEYVLPRPASTVMRSGVSSPIVSIHLWFDHEVMDHEFVGLIGRTVQWLFNRRRISNEQAPGGHVSAVISAAYDMVSLSNEEIIRIALEDLRSAYPRTPAEPMHALVIREKRATLSAGPSMDHLRPGQKTGLKNLFLAGDWTDTGYPATIESAVVSAERCVEFARNCISCAKC